MASLAAGALLAVLLMAASDVVRATGFVGTDDEPLALIAPPRDLTLPEAARRVLSNSVLATQHASSAAVAARAAAAAAGAGAGAGAGATGVLGARKLLQGVAATGTGTGGGEVLTTSQSTVGSAATTGYETHVMTEDHVFTCSKTENTAEAVMECVNAMRTNPDRYAVDISTVCDYNAFRASVVKPARLPLKFNAALGQAAQNHTDRMMAEVALLHQFTNEADIGQRLIDAGYRYRRFGEAITWGERNALAVALAWVCSEEERAHIMSCANEDFGVGMNGDSPTYYTMNVGCPHAKPGLCSSCLSEESGRGYYFKTLVSSWSACVHPEGVPWDGQCLFQKPCATGNPMQYFSLVEVRDNWYNILDHSGKCWDIPGGQLENGVPPVLWPCVKEAVNEMFGFFVSIRGNYNIRSAINGKCIQVKYGSRTEEAKLEQWDCDNSEEQEFRVWHQN